MCPVRRCPRKRELMCAALCRAKLPPEDHCPGRLGAVSQLHSDQGSRPGFCCRGGRRWCHGPLHSWLLCELTFPLMLCLTGILENSMYRDLQSSSSTTCICSLLLVKTASCGEKACPVSRWSSWSPEVIALAPEIHWFLLRGLNERPWGGFLVCSMQTPGMGMGQSPCPPQATKGTEPQHGSLSGTPGCAWLRWIFSSWACP